jgi:phosphoribosylformylglycinamidine (FGAM) synthase-like enzyme
VVKPFVGPNAGPGDAAIVRPVPTSSKGLAIGNGLATGLARDPYEMGLAAIDECVRNMVCVGADPSQIAILDNFCWPSCDDPRNLGSLVRAAEACLDGGIAYGTPFISGKDSLNNQFTTDEGQTIRIPPTLLISGMGIVEDESQATTMDAKRPGNRLVLIGTTTDRLGGSHFVRIGGDVSSGRDELPTVDLEIGPRTARAVHVAITQGLVRSAHDASEGGVLVAAIEMAFSGGLGVEVQLDMVPVAGKNVSDVARAFAEDPCRYLLEVEEGNLDAIATILDGIPHAVIGGFTEAGPDGGELVISSDEFGASSELVDRFRNAWEKGCVR